MGYSPWGRKESDTTERPHFLFFHFQQVKSNFKSSYSTPNTIYLLKAADLGIKVT